MGQSQEKHGLDAGFQPQGMYWRGLAGLDQRISITVLRLAVPLTWLERYS